MLKKEFRLRKSIEIERVAKCGRSIFLRNLGIKYLPNSLALSRFAIAVGLKIHKKAAKRNKVKRQIREIIRLNLDKIKPGFDVLVVPKPSVIDNSYREIEGEILELLKKASLLV